MSNLCLTRKLELDEFVTFFSRESRRLQAAAVESECAGSSVCDSKYALVTGGVMILSHYVLVG